MTKATREKSPKRIAAMRARMADPAFRAKALANIAKGQAALAAKRGKKSDPPPPPPAPQREPDPSSSPASTTRPAFGVGRWRATS